MKTENDINNLEINESAINDLEDSKINREINNNVIKYTTVSFQNLKKWIIIIIIGLIIGYFHDAGYLLCLVGGYFCIKILIKILFNGIKSVTLGKDTFLYSSEKEEIKYRGLNILILTTYCGDFIAYENNQKYWLTIPRITFNDKLFPHFYENYLLANIPVAKENINYGGKEIFYVRSEEDIKKDYRKRDILGKSHDREFKAMRHKVIPLNRLQESIKQIYEEKNILIVEQDGLTVEGRKYSWHLLKPIKLAEDYSGVVIIETKDNEEIASIRGTAILNVPIFEKLYNSMVI